LIMTSIFFPPVALAVLGFELLEDASRDQRARLEMEL
jgi:hypothetical protein